MSEGPLSTLRSCRPAVSIRVSVTGSGCLRPSNHGKAPFESLKGPFLAGHSASHWALVIDNVLVVALLTHNQLARRPGTLPARLAPCPRDILPAWLPLPWQLHQAHPDHSTCFRV